MCCVVFTMRIIFNNTPYRFDNLGKLPLVVHNIIIKLTGRNNHIPLMLEQHGNI